MDEAAEKVVKKITLTREKAGSILDVDPNASLQHIKFAFKRTSYKIYPKDVDTNKEDLLVFELVSAAYKRLASGTHDDVYIEADYPFKLFRKAFKEKRVITIQARNGTFIVLGDKDDGDVNSSEDDFDSSQYTFIRSSRNRYSLAAQNETMTKAEKNRLKKKRQKENKRHAKEDLQRLREELKEEKHKSSNNDMQKVSKYEASSGKQAELSENDDNGHYPDVHTSDNPAQEGPKYECSHDKQKEQLEMSKQSDNVVTGHHHCMLTSSIDSQKIPHDKQEEQLKMLAMSQQSHHDDNVHCPSNPPSKNRAQEVSHGKQEGQLEIPNQSENVDNVHPDKPPANNHNQQVQVSRNEFPHDKPDEQLEMLEHSENGDNMHYPERPTSNNCDRNVLKDKVSHHKQEGQRIRSKQFKNAGNTRYPEKPRSNVHAQTVSENEVSLDKHEAQVKMMSSPFENVGNGNHPNVPKGGAANSCTGHKTKLGIGDNGNRTKPKKMKKPTPLNSIPDHVDVPHGTKPNSRKTNHAKPMLGESDSANQNQGVLNYPPHKISKARSNSHSIHDAPLHSIPIRQSISRVAANKTCKNAGAFNDSLVNGEQWVPNKVGNNEKTHRASAETVQNLSSLGNEDAERGNYIGAIASFTVAIDMDSSSCLLHINRSYCYEKLNNLENALQDANCAIKLSPNWVKGHLRKGRVLAKMKRYSEADKVYEHVLLLDEFNEMAKEELHEVRVELLVSMGYSRQKSSLAVERYPSVSSALENLLAGNLTDLVTDDIYVSDDEEIAHIETASSASNDGQELHERPIAHTPDNFKNGVTDQCVENTNGTSPSLDNNVMTVDSITKMDNEVQYYSVWLGNVTRRVKVGMLRKHFSKFGPIRSVRMHYEGKYAFVNYENPESAPLAAQGKEYVEMTGVKIRISLGPGRKHSSSNKAGGKRNT